MVHRSVTDIKLQVDSGLLKVQQCMETITPVIRHVESQFEKVQSNTSTDPDMLGMLGGDGGSQVDAVLYLIQNSKAHRLLPPGISPPVAPLTRLQSSSLRI